MATLPPPPSKRQKREELERSRVQQDITAILLPDNGTFKARFVDGDGKQMVDVVEVPLADASDKNMSLLLNTLLGRDSPEFLPYAFRVHIPGTDIVVDRFPTDLLGLLRQHGIENPFETTVTLSAEPQSVFRVQSVTRLSHRLPGHSSPILCLQFSPASSSRLATGSGDNTARIWDTETGTPRHTLKGHTGWVLAVSWSPDAERLATCSMDGKVRIWNPETGAPMGKEFSGHAKPVLALAWEPYHLWRNGTARLASASKDHTARIWVVNTGRTECVLSGHKASVSCVKWGGTGTVFTSSHDKTIRGWDGQNGAVLFELKAHAHIVNHLALSTDFVLRTGFFDHHGAKDTPEGEEARRAKARERWEKAATVGGVVRERLASGSDDHIMYLWDPLNEGAKPVAKMLGHQKAINHITFSPDAAQIATSSFDNSTKLWNARNGQFLHTLRGHVGPVFQNAFSADSRLLVTASKDATLKVFGARTGKLVNDLPSHEADVYAVDWSPDGQKVASGGLDKVVRTWRN